MTHTPPQHGDVRVCYVPMIAEHAVAIDVSDMAAAKLVYGAVLTISTLEVEHGLRLDAIDLIVQRYSDDGGWDDVDPSEYDDNQKIED